MTIENFCTIENLISENSCLLDVIYGYCLNTSETIDEMSNLLLILSIIKNNNEKLFDLVDVMNADYLKACNPHLFNDGII